MYMYTSYFFIDDIFVCLYIIFICLVLCVFLRGDCSGRSDVIGWVWRHHCAGRIPGSDALCDQGGVSKTIAFWFSNFIMYYILYFPKSTTFSFVPFFVCIERFFFIIIAYSNSCRDLTP